MRRTNERPVLRAYRIGCVVSVFRVFGICILYALPLAEKGLANVAQKRKEAIPTLGYTQYAL
jgi:hypothetical protein